MSNILHSVKLRVIILPLVGACGAVVAMVWPVGHQAFCSALVGVTL